MNIVVITLDSLRFDSALCANTPNLDTLFATASEQWHKCGAMGTYTLPAHVALLKDGHLPSAPGCGIPIYDPSVQKAFRMDLDLPPKDTLYLTPPAPNLMRGFAQRGYHTIGLGGVGWFSSDRPTTTFWATEYFAEFYWKPEWSESANNAFENQIAFTRNNGLLKRNNMKLFFFVNVASTHYPYMTYGASIQGQAKCLEYVDAHIQDLLDLVPKPCHLFLMADHGDCFGEDGLWKHAFYHKKVMEVPFAQMVIR